VAVAGWLAGITVVCIAVTAAFWGDEIFSDGFPDSAGDVFSFGFLLDLGNLLTFGIFDPSVTAPVLLKVLMVVGLSVAWLLEVL